jgi:hypothetical protein
VGLLVFSFMLFGLVPAAKTGLMFQSKLYSLIKGKCYEIFDFRFPDASSSGPLTNPIAGPFDFFRKFAAQLKLHHRYQWHW